MIKYIGSKRLLAPAIAEATRSLGGIETAADLFTGTTRVAQALKRAGIRVLANDTARYSEVLARCYVAADARSLDPRRLEEMLAHLSSLPPRAGYYTETFCVRSRYFHPDNGARIDAIRDGITSLGCDPASESILLTSLLEAADRVDSTTGLQMAYLKRWAPRALGPLRLSMPILIAGGGEAACRDANRLVRTMDPVDLAYVDPPYNQHSYFGNYHVWESLVRDDRPEVYGVACKRIDCRERGNRSGYNSRRAFRATLEDLLHHLRARTVLLSCSSEGYLDPQDAADLLRGFGKVGRLEVDFKRYVGAQIGIHNPRGEKVGRISHLRNREYLFLAGPDRRSVLRALRAAAAVLADGRSATALEVREEEVRARRRVRRSLESA